jgi:hypothetical protein
MFTEVYQIAARLLFERHQVDVSALFVVPNSLPEVDSQQQSFQAIEPPNPVPGTAEQPTQAQSDDAVTQNLTSAPFFSQSPPVGENEQMAAAAITQN